MNECFDLEEQMRPVVRSHLNDAGYTVWDEAPMGNGRYADLAGARLSEERCRDRLENGRKTPIGSIDRCREWILDPPYGRVPDWYPLSSGTVAVELKLKDWKRALQQASRYAGYVQQSFVAMPEDRMHWVMEERMGDGFLDEWSFPEVGLMAVSEEEVTTIRSPYQLYKDEGMSGYVRHYSAASVLNVSERAWKYWREREEQA